MTADEVAAEVDEVVWATLWVDRDEIQGRDNVVQKIIAIIKRLHDF